MEELKKYIQNSEWTIAYIHADWCKACESNKEIVEEVIKETPDVNFIKVNLSEQQYMPLLKAMDFNSLPFWAVFHSKKIGANPEDVLSCFAGGEAGGGKELPMQMITVIRQLNSQSVV